MTDELSERLDSIQSDILEETDPRELARYLLTLQKFRTQLSAVIDVAHTALSKRLERKETDLGTGIGMVRKQRDVKTTWNHGEMLNLLLDQCKWTDLETGEVNINGYELANAVRECVAFSYWRKTPLRDRKIDFSEYCTEVYGQPRVRFLSKEGH